MNVEDLPIPGVLKEFLVSKRGIRTLYPPQEEAVRAGLLNGENLLMVSATASGKTLMAEVAAVNNVLTNDKKTIITVPLKALAFEKLNDFKAYGELGIRVAASTGDYNSEDRWLNSYDVVITTYEKLDSLLRLKPSWIWDVGQLIIDEIHYVNDEERGPIIESIVAKLRMLNLKPQLIGLSATIGNPEELAKWLNARLVKSDWRPVNLREGVYYRGVVTFVNDGERRVSGQGDPLINLTMDTLNEGGQVLVFSSSRQGAVRIARKLAEYICSSPVRYIDPEEAGKLAEDVREASSSRILADELTNLIKCGVSFHHAGLELEVRRIIEDGFRKGVLKALASTTTLAAGVNLPARRVIINEYRRYEPGFGFIEIPVMEYKQMAGRAGRPGLDPYGEAIVVASSKDEVDYIIDKYIKSPPEYVRSNFMNTTSLKFHILSAIASQYAETLDDLVRFVSGTFAGSQGMFSSIQVNSIKRMISRIVDELVDYGFIVKSGDKFEATEVGSVVNRVYLDPDTAHIFILGLGKLGAGIDLDAYSLMLIVKSPKVPKVKVKRGELDELAQRAASMWGSIPLKPCEEDELLNYPEDYEDFLSEFKTAMALLDWINENSEDQIMKLYDVQPGDLRVLSDQAEWLVSALQELARTLKLSGDVVNGLRALKYRVRYGVRGELLELVVNLEGVGRVRARALFNAGYRTIEDLAKANLSELTRVHGIGERVASSILEQARQLVNEGKVVKFTEAAISGQGKGARGGLLDHIL
ncbi:MAG: DEAD/DEAH box helicase [Caldivirga sp.]|nr:DEAD/DEAH box helicase [Caldivirga sp.]